MRDCLLAKEQQNEKGINKLFRRLSTVKQGHMSKKYKDIFMFVVKKNFISCLDNLYKDQGANLIP